MINTVGISGKSFNRNRYRPNDILYSRFFFFPSPGVFSRGFPPGIIGRPYTGNRKTTTSSQGKISKPPETAYYAFHLVRAILSIHLDESIRELQGQFENVEHMRPQINACNNPKAVIIEKPRVSLRLELCVLRTSQFLSKKQIDVCSGKISPVEKYSL